MIGRIAYRREGGDGSAQCGRSVIYDCIVVVVVVVVVRKFSPLVAKISGVKTKNRLERISVALDFN